MPSHNSPLVSRVKLALVQAGVVVGVGLGVMVTVHEHVLAAETRVCKVVGMEVVEVVGGLEAEMGTVTVPLPEMASTTEDWAVLAEMVGSVTPAGVEVRDVRVAATAVEDDDADTTAATEDGDADTTAAAEDDDCVTAATDVEDGDDDTTATTDEADVAWVLRELAVAVAVAPLTVRPFAWAMAIRGAVLMVAAVTTPLPSMVRVTGSVMFSRAKQPRLPGCIDAEKRFAKKVNRLTATSGIGLGFPAKVA